MWHKNKLQREQKRLQKLMSSRSRFIQLIHFFSFIGMILLISVNIRSVEAYASTDTFAMNREGTYVIYSLRGGRNHWLNPEIITEWSQLKQLHAPYRYGYEFEGWYLDPDFTVRADRFQSGYTDVIMLYAKWNDDIDNVFNVENYSYMASMEPEKNTRRLKDLQYDFVDEVKIPGMPSTQNDEWLNQFIYSQSQVPQGIFITDDYYLITSYSEEDTCMGELLVFNKQTGKLLVTLGMDAKSHLGGIAFDGENVWVCNSNNKTIERLSYDFIKLMAESNTGDVVDCTGVVDAFSVSNTPSCITYYGGRLWIATHNLLLNSQVVAYYYNESENKLHALSSYAIPPQVQGIAFDQDGRVYLSTSYGRTKSSYLKVYDSTVVMSNTPDRPSLNIEMPPNSEEIDIVEDRLYVLFESAGEKYYLGTDGKGRSSCPLDKVLSIDLHSMK